MNIAEYIKKINKEWHPDLLEENEISEMQMNKVLFMIYGAFYNKYHKQLWKPLFEAWDNGPIEKNYSHIGWLDKAVDIETLTKAQKKELERMIKKLLRVSVWELVGYTKTLEVYTNHYKEPIKGVARCDMVIPNKEIRDAFKRIFF